MHIITNDSFLQYQLCIEPSKFYSISRFSTYLFLTILCSWTYSSCCNVAARWELSPTLTLSKIGCPKHLPVLYDRYATQCPTETSCVRAFHTYVYQRHLVVLQTDNYSLYSLQCLSDWICLFHSYCNLFYSCPSVQSVLPFWEDRKFENLILNFDPTIIDNPSWRLPPAYIRMIMIHPDPSPCFAL